MACLWTQALGRCSRVGERGVPGAQPRALSHSRAIMVAKAISTTAPTTKATQKKDPKQMKGNKHQKLQKKTVNPEERVKRLFNSLCAQIDGGHFKNALKTCDKSKLVQISTLLVSAYILS